MNMSAAQNRFKQANAPGGQRGHEVPSEGADSFSEQHFSELKSILDQHEADYKT